MVQWHGRAHGPCLPLNWNPYKGIHHLGLALTTSLGCIILDFMICQNTAYALVRCIGMAKTGPPRDEMSKFKAPGGLTQSLMHKWINEVALAGAMSFLLVVGFIGRPVPRSPNGTGHTWMEQGIVSAN